MTQFEFPYALRAQINAQKCNKKTKNRNFKFKSVLRTKNRFSETMGIYRHNYNLSSLHPLKKKYTFPSSFLRYSNLKNGLFLRIFPYYANARAHGKLTLARSISLVSHLKRLKMVPKCSVDNLESNAYKHDAICISVRAARAITRARARTDEKFLNA